MKLCLENVLKGWLIDEHTTTSLFAFLKHTFRILLYWSWSEIIRYSISIWIWMWLIKILINTKIYSTNLKWRIICNIPKEKNIRDDKRAFVPVAKRYISKVNDAGEQLQLFLCGRAESRRYLVFISLTNSWEYERFRVRIPQILHGLTLVISPLTFSGTSNSLADTLERQR